MIKTLLTSGSILLYSLAIGQADGYPNGSTVADFTVTDTDGNTHTLYEITAQGKYVVLDFFFADCPPCQQTQAIFNDLFETYGCNQHDLFVMSINNGNDNDAQVVAYEAQYGGSGVHSPAVSNEGGGPEVDAAFGIAAYPTYVLIGPDNEMINNDIWPISSVQSFVNAFPPGSNIEEASCLVGIEERVIAAGGRFYPSPGNGSIVLELATTTSGRIIVEVNDALGRAIERIDLGKREAGQIREPLDLQALPDGSYTIRTLLNDRQLVIGTLVIAH